MNTHADKLKTVAWLKYSSPNVCLEAAAEIERLEAALADKEKECRYLREVMLNLKNHSEDRVETGDADYWQAIRMADAALENKEATHP